MNSLARAISVLCAVSVAGMPMTAAAAPDLPELWREYAAAAVSPRFDWVTAKAEVPGVLALLQGAASSAHRGARPLVSAQWLEAAAAMPLVRFEASQPAWTATLSGQAFDADYQGSRLALSTGGSQEFGLTAIVARQQFATRGFGYGAWDGVQPRRQIGVGTDLVESAEGSGVRLDYAQVGNDLDWRWQLALQSRIEMDAFNAFRGVYAEPGDFDVPGFVRAALETDLAPGVSLQLEAQRVFYSEVTAFAAAALPTRFLSLLGDGTSPSFAWRDLTVYAVEGRLADHWGGQWSLRASTQEQPKPTSAILDRALSELYAEHNLALAYRIQRPGLGELAIGASYAPETYFLGASPYLSRQFAPGEQVEFEAHWSFAF